MLCKNKKDLVPDCFCQLDSLDFIFMHFFLHDKHLHALYYLWVFVSKIKFLVNFWTGASGFGARAYNPAESCWMEDRYVRACACYIPTLSSLPNTVLSPRAEQFQRPCLNWNWHSRMPIWTPSPITMMASGRLWQMVLWRGASPGILLQMMLAPNATTDQSPLWGRGGLKFCVSFACLCATFKSFCAKLP